MNYKIPKTNNTYHIYLAKEDKERLDVIAFLNKCTRNDLMKHITKEYLEKHKDIIDKTLEFRKSLPETIG